MTNNPRQIRTSTTFLRRIKQLKKKYRRVEDDLRVLFDVLREGETPGDRLQGVGDYIVYKTRLASQDLQRGKSGGFRVIYYLRTETHTFLLTIYIKTEQEDISAEEILQLIAEVEHELAGNDE